MKALIEKETKIIKHIGCEYNLSDSHVEVTGKENFIFSDLNGHNSYVIEVDNIPDDWIGNKYKYNNGWIKNENYKENK